MRCIEVRSRKVGKVLNGLAFVIVEQELGRKINDITTLTRAKVKEKIIIYNKRGFI
jgi:hypothetical protein